MWEVSKKRIRVNSSWIRKEHLQKNWKVLRHQQVEMVGGFLSDWKGCHSFLWENALSITVHQIIFLQNFPILPDSYFRFVLETSCHKVGSWHFWQALIIHVFYLEAKSIRSFQSGSYSWADREAPSLALASSHLPGSLTPWQFSPPGQKSGWQDPFKTATSKSHSLCSFRLECFPFLPKWDTDLQTILWEKPDSMDDLKEHKGPLVAACLCFHWLNLLTDQLFCPWISHGCKQDK